MPVTPTHPGVYIEEIPSGVRTITGVSTSVAAFVGGFNRGVIDVAVPLFSVADLERELGGLRSDSEATYAIQQFFLNGGATAWAVRVAGEDDDGPAAPAEVTLQDVDEDAALPVFAGRQIRGRSVTDPGVWGNQLRVEVDHDTRDPTDTALFNLTVSEVASADGRRVVLRSETFANCSTAAGSSDFALTRINAGSKMIQARGIDPAAPEPEIGRPAPTGTTGIAFDTTATFTSSSTVQLHVGADEHAVVLTSLAADTVMDSPQNVTLVRRALEDAIRSVGRSEDDAHLAGASVTLRGDAFHVRAGGRTDAGFDAGLVLRFTDGVAAELGLTGAGVVENVQQYALGDAVDRGMQVDGTPGTDGGPPDTAALIGSASAKTGMQALVDVDLFTILVLPDAVSAGVDAAAVYAAAEALCEAERAFLIVDVDRDTDEWQEAIDWIDAAGIRHRNAAVYFPRVRIPDPLDDGRLRSVGASGTMAGVYARTDGERGVWKAPAGLEAVLRGVQDFDTTLTDAENGQLNPVAINALRRFPIYGRVSWGARTLEGADVRASEWKYVPVRRFALFLEESLYRGMQWAVFEPNDVGLWAQIRLNVGAFMHGLFRQGAFQGSSPREAYFVKCDAETTTQADIDRGIVNVVVGFAPLKPAEFVIIQIQQMAGQLQA